jgi:exonuclease III
MQARPRDRQPSKAAFPYPVVAIVAGMTTMRDFIVVSWNCRRATAGSRLWEYLLDLDPSVALLQEVGELSPAVAERYTEHVLTQGVGWKSGVLLKFRTGLLVRGRIGEEFSLKGFSGWTDAELDRYAGDLVCRQVVPDDGPPLRVVSVYSPAWEIDRDRLEGIDTSEVRLSPQKDVWLADVLWASLRRQPPRRDEAWIIGGDFNYSETFDAKTWSKGGNAEYLQRMADLGLVECLRTFQGALTPTFKTACNGRVEHQIDHLFVTKALAERLVSCETGSQERVFGCSPMLSDHLPIIARFDCHSGCA